MSTPEDRIYDRTVNFSDVDPIDADTQLEFEEAGSPQDGTSVVRRPDALSFSYLISFSFGPVALQDPSEGLLVRVWRARLDGNDVKLAYADGEVWSAETTLFSSAGIEELDLCFTQNGDPVVAVQKNSNELWIYWFDPQVGSFVLQQFGTGFSPQCLIDDPINTSDSDVQVFYVGNGGISYRQQRDRYDTEYLALAANNIFIEDVFRSRGLRLHVTYVEHVGTSYVLKALSSTLFPITLEIEELRVANTITLGELRVAVLVPVLGLEELDVEHSITSGELNIATSTYPVEAEISTEITTLGIVIQVIIIEQTIDLEELDVENSITSGTLDVIIIVQTLDIEELDVENSITSGSLAVV